MHNRLLHNVTLTPVDPAYVKVVAIRNVLGNLPFVVVPLVVAIILGSFTFPGLIWWIVFAVALISAVTFTTIAIKRAKSIGYAEREEDLIVAKGVLFRKASVVPYGRMQQVNLGTGPLMSKFNLASVDLVTASAESDASIPGIQKDEADRLREKLTALGEAKLEGL